MTIYMSVREEIARLPVEASESVGAKVALTLAERLDNAGNRDSAGLARELRNTLDELRAAYPVKTTKHDPLTQLEGNRDLRVVKDAS